MSKNTNNVLVKRKLGKTDIDITPIGQGVMQFAGGHTFLKFLYNKMDDNLSNRIVKTALDSGINWFDTAEAYGGGISETKLAKSLKAAKVKDEEVILATKWSPVLRRSKSVKKTISDRLKYLEPYTIDLHQIHNQMSVSSIRKQVDAMADLYDEGKIRSVGVSNFSAKNTILTNDILKERGLTLASNQVNYSLIHRNIESNGLLDAAKELGITIIAWSPLQMGVLTGIYHFDENAFKDKKYGKKIMIKRHLNKSLELMKEIDQIAKSHKVTIAQVALNWLVNYHGDTVVAIPGATKPKQAELNGQAMNFNLTKTELNDVEELSREFL